MKPTPAQLSTERPLVSLRFDGVDFWEKKTSVLKCAHAALRLSLLLEVFARK